jgi:hypothetical protein
MSNDVMWWGYLHSNGSVQLKRWSGDVKDYTEDCEGNDFVVRVVEPFSAPDREQAECILVDRLAQQTPIDEMLETLRRHHLLPDDLQAFFRGIRH